MDITDDTIITTTYPSIDELRSLFSRSTELAAEVMDAVAPDQHDLPAVGMTVRELAEHVVMAVRRTACAARSLPFEEWPMDGKDVPAGEWGAATRSSSADVVDAWAGIDPHRPTDLPWGNFAADNVLAVYINEVTVHTWDLARATGQAPSFDDDVIAAASIAIHQQLPTADRDPMWEALAATLPEGIPWEAPFGNAVPVPDESPALERLVAWNGRQP